MDKIWERQFEDCIKGLEGVFKDGLLHVGDKLPLMHWEGRLEEPAHPSNATYTEIILTADWKKQIRKHYEQKLAKSN